MATGFEETVGVGGAIIFGWFVLAIGIGVWTWTLLLVKKGPKALFGYGKVTVGAFENIVVYRRGRFEKVLESGLHWIRSGEDLRLVTIDMRPEVFQVAQGAVTIDRVPVVLRCIARVQIEDARQAVETTRDYRSEINATLQSTIKGLAQERVLKDLYLRQREFDSAAQQKAEKALKRLGITCMNFELLHTESSGELPDFDGKDMGFHAH